MPSKPTLPRDEIDVAFDEVMAELFGPDPDGDENCPAEAGQTISVVAMQEVVPIANGAS
jgi:hypothetical protein